MLEWVIEAHNQFTYWTLENSASKRNMAILFDVEV